MRKRKKLLVVLVVEVVVLLLLVVACSCLGAASPDVPGEPIQPDTVPQDTTGQIENVPADTAADIDVLEDETTDILESEDVASGLEAVDVDLLFGSDDPPETTKPAESTKPSQTTKPTKPTESTKPTKPNDSGTPDVDLGIDEIPDDMLDPSEPTKPSDSTKPGNPSGPMDYEKYTSLSAEDQSAYRATFDSISAFFEWYNAAKADYDAKNPGIDVGSGTIDLEEIMNGSR